MEPNIKNTKAKAVTRLVVLIVLLLNTILTGMGKNPIPWDESQITEFINYILTAAWSLYTWWKNNNLTPEAETAQGVLENMKSGKAPSDPETDDPGDAE